MGNLTYMRVWRAANPEKCKAYDKKWKHGNKETRRAYERKWRKEHPEHYRAYRKKRRLDPQVLIRDRLRCRIHAALFVNNVTKTTKTIVLIGCAWKKLHDHVAATFQPGMTWENRHLWHIDHIRPCASFDLTDPEQQKICFHYSNHQALWAKDNLSKGSKLTWEPSSGAIPPQIEKIKYTCQQVPQ